MLCFNVPVRSLTLCFPPLSEGKHFLRAFSINATCLLLQDQFLQHPTQPEGPPYHLDEHSAATNLHSTCTLPLFRVSLIFITGNEHSYLFFFCSVHYSSVPVTSERAEEVE